MTNSRRYFSFIGSVLVCLAATISTKIHAYEDEYNEAGPIYVVDKDSEQESIDKSLPESIIYITKTGKWYSSQNIDGLAEVSVKLVSEGKILEEVFAVSGRQNNQVFNLEKHSFSGSKEPAPEAVYYIPEGPVNVPKDHRNYDPLGPWWIWIEFDFEPQSKYPRRFLGIHTDFDRVKKGKGGTLGCIGTHTTADMKKIVSWFEGHFSVQAPTNVIVDWGKGSVASPYTL